MKQINQYIVIKELESFNDQIMHWHCQKENIKENYELLTIAIDGGKASTFDLRLLGELQLLLGKEFSGIQSVKEIGLDKENGCYFVAYEYKEDYRPLNERRQLANVQSIIDITRGLGNLKKKNLENYAISPKYIRIDSKGRGLLCFVGLFELFAKQDLLESHYLSPNGMVWVKKAKENLVRPSTNDDMYGLIKSFEFVLKDLKKYTAANELLSKGLDKKNVQRFARYNELIDLLGQLPVRTEQDENRKAFKIAVNRKRIDANTLRLLLKDMNNGVWLDMANRRSERGALEGHFSTTAWNGKFVVNQDKSLFIPHCNQEPNDRILNSQTAFKLNASFGEYPSNYNCIPFFKEQFELKKELLALHKKQHRLVQEWKLLPKQEQEQIEAAALKIAYYKRVEDKKGNIGFYINGGDNLTDNTIKKIQQKRIRLVVNRQQIGDLLEYRSSEQFLLFTNVQWALEEIPHEGILRQDTRLEISQFRKQIDACDKFEELAVANPSLCEILARPKMALLPEVRSSSEENYNQFKKTIFNTNIVNDQTQLEAVWEGLNRKPLHLIQGPPGTGKTTVIVELIQQILKKETKAKILLTSQSNLAVDNVLERIHEVNKTADKELSFMRLASTYSLDKETISNEILPYTFEQKLEKWIKETTKKSTYNFANKFDAQQQQKLKEVQENWLSFIEGISERKGKETPVSMLNDGSVEVDFLTAMMRDVNIIGATCIHIASGKYSSINFEFDYVIMDESSKASPPETLVPINMGRNIILIGDHKQLPPVITRDKKVRTGIENELEDNGLDFNKTFGKSLFEILIEAFEQDPKKQFYRKMLDIQYRMPKQIGRLISKFFYDGQLKNPSFDSDKDKEHGLPFKKDTSIVFISTSKQENPTDNGHKLLRNNLCNVEKIKELLDQLNNLYSGNLKQKKPLTIGVIAGYRGQVNLLRKELDLSKFSSFVQTDKKNGTNLITIDTVDKFQGAERDIIIYDVVRSSAEKQNVIGFLEDYRRINVAFSRVKRLLIVVGDSEYLRHRAILHPESNFQEFKLQQITEELHEQGLIYHNLSEILVEG